MKKITEHKNGTYSIEGLSFDELNFLNSACMDLLNEVRHRKEVGKVLNEFTIGAKNFAEKLSDIIVDITTK